MGWDHFSPLVAFWQELIEDAHGLAERVRGYYPLSRDAFYALQGQFRGLGQALQEEPRGEDPRRACQKELAAAFYVLNRASFSGTTLSGGMSPGHPRFTPRSIDKLVALDVSNVKVEHADFRDSLPQCPAESLLYLDPPYANGEALYGNRGRHAHRFSPQRAGRSSEKKTEVDSVVQRLCRGPHAISRLQDGDTFVGLWHEYG